MKTKLSIAMMLLGVYFLGHAARCQADAVTVHCPDTLAINESADGIDNWKVYISSATHGFSRMKIYSNQPQGKVALDPDNADEDTSDYRWTLGDAGDNLSADCFYHSSAVRLTQQLPKGLHTCEAEKSGTSMSLRCE